MTGAIFLLGAALLGIGLVRRFFGEALNRPEQVLWGFVIGWSLATAVGYVCARVAGNLSFVLTLLVTLFVWLGTGTCWLPVLRGISRKSWRGIVSEPSLLPLAIVLCLFAPIYLRLFSTHMLRSGADGGLYSGGESSLYDLAYHAAITSSFVHGANFPPVYTPMPPAPLLYPFFPDFLTALLMATGWNLHSALVWTAVPMSLVLTGIFYCFALRVLKLASIRNEARIPRAAAIATLLFFFNGGLGFIYFFQDWRTSGKSLWFFLSHLETNYSHLASRGIVWPNLITDMLLPQRTSIFGLSLGLIILACFALTWANLGEEKSANKWQGWQPLLLAGLLAGLLPFFHVHSYAAVGLVSGFLFMLRPRRVWLFFWVPAVVLAIAHFLPAATNIGDVGFIRFQPGWRGQGEPNWIVFWLRNVGLLTLLVVPAWFAVSTRLRRFYLAFLGILGLALLFVFSPNDYDNLKLLTYWHALTCVVVAAWLVRLARYRWGRICVVAFITVSMAPALLAIVYEWQSNKRMFDKAELMAADFAATKTAPHSLFLTAPSLHQPVLSMAGRAVVRGPTAWLWSHGYPFAEREADVRAIYSGRDNAIELLRYYRVDYVYLGRHEIRELNANRTFFDSKLETVYRSEDITIYDARKLRDSTVPADRFAGYPPREYASRLDRDPSQILSAFPVVAYQLYRLHRVAFGGPPRRGEFMSDLRQLGAKLYIGVDGWRTTLELNKRTLCDDWSQRSDFKERYDSMTDAQYIAALCRNGALTMSDSERGSIGSAIASGRETRASVLAHLSADPRLFPRDYNAAFVLCHYFSYLGRNPDEPPDHALTGYNFWRSQLDRTRDYRGLTRAFLESDEYRRQPPR